MGVMIRDINLGLFILILATLIAFAGFTSYYQTTFTNLSLEYRTKLGELEKVSTTLQSEKARLNLTSYQLKIKAERETDLSKKYELIRELKEQLEKDKAALESELSKTKSELKEKSVQLAGTKEELSKKATELGAANAEIASLGSRIDTLRSDIKNKDAKINALCTKLKELGQSC